MKRLQPIRCSNAGTSEFQERVPWAPRVPRRAKLVNGLTEPRALSNCPVSLPATGKGNGRR